MLGSLSLSFATTHVLPTVVVEVVPSDGAGIRASSVACEREGSIALVAQDARVAAVTMSSCPSPSRSTAPRATGAKSTHRSPDLGETTLEPLPALVDYLVSSRTWGVLHELEHRIG
jgi:hypothetical protein